MIIMVLRVHLTTHAEIVCVIFECVGRMWVSVPAMTEDKDENK